MSANMEQKYLYLCKKYKKSQRATTELHVNMAVYWFQSDYKKQYAIVVSFYVFMFLVLTSSYPHTHRFMLMFAFSAILYVDSLET